MPNNDVEIALLRTEVEQLRAEVAALTTSTKEMVDAWKAAKGTLTFIKFLAGFTTAVAAAILIIRGLWPHN